MAEANDLPALVQVIAVVALVAGIGALILNEFQENQEVTAAVVNDTITFTALDTAYSLLTNSTSETYWVRLVNNTVYVSNQTGGGNWVGNVTRGGNWSVNVATGTITAITGGVFAAGDAANVSYSWTDGSAAYNAFGDGITGLVEATSWLDLVALAIMAGVLLMVVVRSVQSYRSRQPRY